MGVPWVVPIGGAAEPVTTATANVPAQRSVAGLEAPLAGYGVYRLAHVLPAADESCEEAHGFIPGMPLAESISASTRFIAVGSIAETPWNGCPS
jgi:hypothetical protein